MALCVGVGGAIGVALSKDDGAEAWDAERVAALALDTRGLSEDARGLSRAIEEAVAREDLEGEAEALRVELRGLAARARRIRARADSADVASADGTRIAVSRGLRKVDTTLTAFQQEVVSPLETVIREAESPEASEDLAVPSVDDALAGVTAALDEQDEALTTLATNLDDLGGEKDTPVTAEESEAKAEDSLLSGAFQAAPLGSDGVLDVAYELQGLEAEQGSEAGAGEVDISASASAGEVSLSNDGTGRVTLDLPTFHLILYWKRSELPRGASEAGLRLAPPEEDGTDEEDGDGAGADPCHYEIEGSLHCALAWFELEEVPDHRENDLGEAVFDPGEEIRIGAPESAGAVIAAGADADSVAELIASASPDYVQVLVADPAYGFQPACAVPVPEEDGRAVGGEEPNGTPETAASDTEAELTVGLLTGDGDSVFEATEPREPAPLDSEGGSEAEAPECYGLAPESS